MRKISSRAIAFLILTAFVLQLALAQTSTVPGADGSMPALHRAAKRLQNKILLDLRIERSDSKAYGKAYHQGAR